MSYFTDSSMLRRVHRERAREIVLDPPVPWVARPEYGFAPLRPAVVRKLVVAGGAEYVKRVVIPFLPDRLRLVPAARAA